MRILRVAQKVYPDVKGGAPYHVHAMSRDQAAMGHDVTVLTVRQDDSLPQIEQRDGYTVIRFDSLISPFGNDISPSLAKYLQEADDFDVIHAHSHLYFSTNVAALKCYIGNGKMALTNHGLFSQNAPEWVFDLYLRTLGRWTFNQADVIFSYTEADKERVREYGVSSESAVVSNGIDTERFTPDGPESELIESDVPVVLFVGRLVEGKQPSVALDAFAKLLSDGTEATLCFCGEGPLREELEEKANALGIEESVIFLRQVPYEEMPDVYRSVDVLLLPSRAEGVPRTVMEALSAGVPVVSSELAHVRDAFGEAVVYAEVGDVDGFCEGVRDVLDDGVAGELPAGFRWEQTVEETTAWLEEIVRG